jgi:outer membrane protein assembly factor BamB
MSEDRYRIVGNVISSSTGQGVAGARVEAWDKDLHVNDLVGSAVTAEDGSFVIEFDSSYFRELFADRRPDLFFKVFLQDRLIKSTEDSVLWNVDAHDIPVTIEVDIDVRRTKSIDEAPRNGPRVLRVTNDFDANEQLKIRTVDNPLPNSTLGIASQTIQVSGPEEFQLTPLVIPFDVAEVTGIDLSTVRVFRLDEANKKFKPVWNSGVNPALSYFWANICRPGTYVAIGAPRDILLREALRQFSLARDEFDGCGNEKRQEILQRAFRVFLDAPADVVEELRDFLTRMEIQTGPGLETLGPHELRLGKGGHPLPFPLPQDADLQTLTRRLTTLDIAADGLPEEELLRPRDLHRDVPPWDVSGPFQSWNGVEDFHVEKLRIWDVVGDLRFIDVVLPWLRSKDWWMHQHDVRHSGVASGGSNIDSSSAGRLYRQSAVAVDGPVITKPAIVDGKIYIGSGNTGGGGGTLYKIDLGTGTIENTFATSGTAFYSWRGIGGSPTVLNNRVYISTVYGKIYCLDATTFTQLWMTDLKNASQSQNQPINNPDGDSWSGPLVVNNRVYVSGGEGESPNPFGFVFCLDATNGHVIWIFCTNKFVNPDSAGSENQPNVIPASAAVSNPLPAWATSAGFSLRTGPADPPHKGASPWSSCAYDSVFNRVFVCTGNSRPDNPLPDERYASGLLSLDATTGQFRGFFQPLQSDSYWPGDFDVDVPCSPTVYTRSGGQRVVCFGSKNGSFFILDADTLAVVARRQLLPKQNGSGLPGDVGTPISTVVPLFGTPPTGENKWGVMATPAVSGSLGRIFVGLGGYAGIGDSSKTPFMRALDWNNLQDAWSTTLGGDGVTRYNTTNPPMYLTNEAGLSAPALVNDVVFISTSKTALYALSADTGVCLWSASSSSLGGNYSLGPAIYGDYVVVGAGNTVYIYKLRRRFWIPPDLVVIEKWPRWPWPDPDPRVIDLLGEILNQVRR